MTSAYVSTLPTPCTALRNSLAIINCPKSTCMTGLVLQMPVPLQIVLLEVS